MDGETEPTVPDDEGGKSGGTTGGVCGVPKDNSVDDCEDASFSFGAGPNEKGGAGLSVAL